MIIIDDIKSFKIIFFILMFHFFVLKNIIFKPIEQNLLLICRNRLYFDNRINNERLRDLFNQYVYVRPEKEIMNEYPSPDELDSLGYAFMEIQKVIRL